MNKPFRIGLVMQGGTGWMGGIEYIKNIVLSLSILPEEVRNKFEICLICDRSLNPSLYESIVPYLKEVFYIEKTKNLKTYFQKAKKIIFRECPFGIEIATFLDLNPNHGLDFIYPYTPYGKVDREILTASWIPDFQHKYLPHLFSSLDIFLRNVSFNYISRKSPKVVVSSKSAEADFYKFFPGSQAEVKVLSFTTFPLPEWYTNDREEILNIYSLPQKFFLVSNQFWKHKNHEIVFKAISILKSRGIKINVVCTGKLEDARDKEYTQEVREMISYLEIDKQIYLLDLIPKNHQVQIIRSAIAIIQPSLFEGWSTVVEDARCFGKKIALSRIPVHLEQAPPQAFYFDKENADELADILTIWWESTENGFDFQQELVARQNSISQTKQIAHNILSIAGIS